MLKYQEADPWFYRRRQPLRERQHIFDQFSKNCMKLKKKIGQIGRKRATHVPCTTSPRYTSVTHLLYQVTWRKVEFFYHSSSWRSQSHFLTPQCLTSWHPHYRHLLPPALTSNPRSWLVRECMTQTQGTLFPQYRGNLLLFCSHLCPTRRNQHGSVYGYVEKFSRNQQMKYLSWRPWPPYPRKSG